MNDDDDDPLRDLPERTRDDPGAPFETATLAMLTAMEQDEPAEFARLLERLRKEAGFRGIVNLRKAIGNAGGRPGRSQADDLVALARDAGLFHTANRTAYADLEVDRHRETWPIDSKGFRQWLAQQLYAKTKGSAGKDALNAAIGTLASRAIHEGPEREVCLRVGEHGDAIYIDLADASWRAVEVDANGWRVVDRPPLRFVRTPAMQPLPVPVRGGSIDTLRRFLNVSDGDFVLVVGWLLASLNPRGPYPVLVFAAEAGAAKSSSIELLRRLVDPNEALARMAPKNPHDLYVSATQGWVQTYDNLSYLNSDLSDAMCCLATGGGLVARRLYTDGDEHVFNAMRPQIIASIEHVVLRQDLADRSIFLELKPIGVTERLTKRELDAAFASEQQGIFGCLLDGFAEGLRRLPDIKIEELPRMADFATWATACETAYWPEGAFMAVYRDNIDDASKLLLEGSIVAIAIRAMPARRDIEMGENHWTAADGGLCWEGTASELLFELEWANHAITTKNGWPVNANTLGSKLRRLAPALRKSGIDIDHRKEGRERTRKVTLFFAPAPAEPAEANTAAAAAEVNNAMAPTTTATTASTTTSDRATKEQGRDDARGGRSPIEEVRAEMWRLVESGSNPRAWLTREWLRKHRLATPGELDERHLEAAIEHIQSLATP